jgi:hypothetical protein
MHEKGMSCKMLRESVTVGFWVGIAFCAFAATGCSRTEEKAPLAKKPAVTAVQSAAGAGAAVATELELKKIVLRMAEAEAAARTNDVELGALYVRQQAVIKELDDAYPNWAWCEPNASDPKQAELIAHLEAARSAYRARLAGKSEIEGLLRQRKELVAKLLDGQVSQNKVGR